MPATMHPPAPPPAPPTGKAVEGALTLLAALVIAGLLKYRPKWKADYSAHGTARLANARDCKHAGLFSGKGLLLGRTLDKRNRLLHLPKYVHLSIFAPAGAGKGVSLAIPTLLTYTGGSCVVLDAKGELYRATAEKRRAMGQKVVVLDPFHVVTTTPDSLNSLDLIGTGAGGVDGCRALACATVVTTGQEKDPHFNLRATDVITGGLSYIAANFTGPERCIGSLREIVTTPGMFEGCAKALLGMGGVFARLGGSMLSLEDKEKASVLSTVNSHTTFADSEPILQATASGWDARELLTGTVALYLVLPPHQLDAQSRWLRLVISTLLRLVGQHGMTKGKECLFLLDEAGQLGHMDPIEQGLTLLRAAGIRLMLFYQSLGQLNECWREKQSVLLDNTAPIFFGVQSYETAERVSKMLDTETCVAENYSFNSSTSEQAGAFGEKSQGATYSTSHNVSTASHARALLTPGEILNLPEEVAIGFFKGLPPLAFRRVLYYSDPLFQRFSRLRQIAKRAVLSLLVGVLFAVLFNIRSFTK